MSSLGTDSGSDWPVRVELLGFFLHAADRFAFQASGADIRDVLLEDTTAIAAETLVRSTWQGTDTSPRADAWIDRMKEETIHNLDVANAEYGECTEPISQKWSPDQELWRLVVRIVGDTGTLDDFHIVAAAIPKGFLGSNLIQVTMSESRRRRAQS